MLESLTSSLGLMARTEEKLMDTFTGFTGSGPAYVYLFIQALADGAVRNGVKRELAIKFAAQTVYGAAKLVLETNKHPAELVDSVMTPAGTTAEGILVLEKSAFKANIVKAVTAATKRSSDLGAGMGAFKYNLKNEL
jgi:pyrroline-5-carboxylate reductase